MPYDANPGLPPPHLIEALRAPRRPRLDDPQAREMFRRWRRLGRPIRIEEINELVDFLMPEPWVSVDRIKDILEAVNAAGFAFDDDARSSDRRPMPDRLALRRALANVCRDANKLAASLATGCLGQA
jgi:hypothetical protein